MRQWRKHVVPHLEPRHLNYASSPLISLTHRVALVAAEMPFTDRSQGEARSPSHRPMLPAQTSTVPRARLIGIFTIITSILTFVLLYTNTTSLSPSPTPPPAHSRPCPELINSELTIHTSESPFPLTHGTHLGTDGEEIAALFQKLTRSTPLTLISTTPLQADTQEPEGMVITTDKSHLIISSTPKDPGANPSLLLFSLSTGALLATLSLSSTQEPHNGGLDSNGTHIYLTLSGSKPITTATIYSLSLDDFSLRSLLNFPSDHIGTLIAPRNRWGHVIGMNWGSRAAYTFLVSDECTTQDAGRKVDNPSHFVDYQDCKLLTESLALCSGVSSLNNGEYRLGGVALVDVKTMTSMHEVPVTLESDQGTRITMNPFDVAVVSGKLTFYWAPDQHNTSLYSYEADV